MANKGQEPGESGQAPRKPNPPHDWTEKFIAAYSKVGNISHAARLAGIDRTTVYKRCKSDPIFNALFEDGREEASDMLELEAHRRAVKGTLKPVFHQGKKCGQIREYSDTLLIVLLKANRPERFRENVRAEVTGPAGGPIPIREVIVRRPADAAEPV